MDILWFLYYWIRPLEIRDVHSPENRIKDPNYINNNNRINNNNWDNIHNKINKLLEFLGRNKRDGFFI